MIREDGYDMWLRYRPIEDIHEKKQYMELFQGIVADRETPVIKNAIQELLNGIKGMLGVEIPVSGQCSERSEIVLLQTKSEFNKQLLPKVKRVDEISEEGYSIQLLEDEGKKICIVGKSEKGILYGVFHLLRILQMRQEITADFYMLENPCVPLRVVNHWDNIRGDIERGTAGYSIFQWNQLPDTTKRYYDYARLLASVGINSCCINNVNTSTAGSNGYKLITNEYLVKMKALADIFISYGIRLFISIDFASPILIGGMETADPLDENVKAWWKQKVAEIYEQIPSLGGFVIKANSENQPGPHRYGRTHKDGANMLGEALKPYEGVLFWRAFVYDHTAGDIQVQPYHEFMPLDGEFLDNVIIQIKNGPRDFQVREPLSPLLSRLTKTNQCLEFQIMQEYLGHSTHVCNLMPYWQEVLAFNTFAKEENSSIADLISGKTFDLKHTAVAGVSNIGDDRNWTGHHLAQANAYGFGRLCWNPYLSAEEIIKEWVSVTFSKDPEVLEKISWILLQSRKAYENYTTPFGIGMVVGEGQTWETAHYDPAPMKRMEEKFFFADENGIGYDRTVKTGSGMAGQYYEENAKAFEDIYTCPEEVLLWFHFVPYDFKMKSGETLIQSLYDTYFEGYETVLKFRDTWFSLMDKIDSHRFEHVLHRLEDQIKHARIWRDYMNSFLFHRSGIKDKYNRPVDLYVDRMTFYRFDECDVRASVR